MQDGVHTVLHFAANMGGMGTIHEDNNFEIFRQNNAMTTNLLEAAVDAQVKTFLFASSACVYPSNPQSEKGVKPELSSLKEEGIFDGDHVSPQGLYGSEKLVGEVLLRQYAHKIAIRIARFHNVYGPRGVYFGGREKVPAAFARKAVMASLSMAKSKPYHFEIWGDGTQQRSFLYIDDCVDAVMRLLECDYSKPLNIGSDRVVSIQDLASIAIKSVKLDSEQVKFVYDHTKPKGVQFRNSNNDRVEQVMRWKPQISLEAGIQRTVDWIKKEMQKLSDDGNLDELYCTLEQSQVLDLKQTMITFGVLLPMTSRGHKNPGDCIELLRNFAASLVETTWHDIHTLKDVARFRIKIYLAFDDDDTFLNEKSKPAEHLFASYGLTDITTIVCSTPRGYVCHLWRFCANQAWKDGCQYMALFGDDVTIVDSDWLHKIHIKFQDVAKISNTPHGLGCVAFTNQSFPGMPTFPVLHRTHLDVFKGDVIPDKFINQDGDPFLFQLYRRFGTAVMVPCRIQNNIGGSDTVRYEKQHLEDWTFDVLDDATNKIKNWLEKRTLVNPRKLTIDVVIPSFRVDVSILSTILDLKSSDTCEVMFIIVVDDPNAKELSYLIDKYAARVDVRIRVNSETLGASASRNRGIKESAAEWIHFLDDDVIPAEDLLVAAERNIRAWPDVAGFVAKTQFPPADNIFKAAVHLAGVTYFWDIADKITNDVPWGVTANLLVKRERDGIEYDLRFIKTGGGEDIDYCIRRRNYSIEHNRQGFRAAPDVLATHPWWFSGRRSYMRFYNWARGDGALINKYPQYCYQDSAPNSAELMMISLGITIVGVLLLQEACIRVGLCSGFSICCANIVHDYHRLLFSENVDSRIAVDKYQIVMAIPESTFIRMLREIGRLVGQCERGELQPQLFRQRFDWFLGRDGSTPVENERYNSRARFIIWLCVLLLTQYHLW